MRPHRTFIVATCVLALAAVTSCAASEPSTSPTGETSHGSPTSTATPTSDTDAASKAATETVSDYFGVLDELRQDHDRSLDALTAVATSTQLTVQKQLLENERSRKLRQVGSTDLAKVSVESVNLDNSDPKAGKVPTVMVDICWDVSKADLIDPTGKSVVSPDRVEVGWTRYTVANYDYQTDPLTGWRVASGKDLEQPPCEA